MRKYWAIVALFFKSQLSWRFSIALNMLFIVVKIVFAVVVWGAAFEHNGEVAGFTLGSMLSYYVVSSLLSQMETVSAVGSEVASRIRGGTFSKYMIIPVRAECYFIAQTFGAMGLYALFALAATALSTLIFRIPLELTRSSAHIAAAVGMELIGLLFMVRLDYLLGIFAFKFQEIWSFLMIKGALVSFATGAIVPLAILPDGMRSVMRMLPFYYVTYLPSMLFIGRGAEEIGPGFVVLGIWLAAISIISPLCYATLRKRFDGVGI